MVVVSVRDFLSHQRKYLELARTGDVVIRSRKYGSFRIVPVKEDDDTLIDAATLDAKIRKGIADYKQGKGYRVTTKEELERFLDSVMTSPIEAPDKEEVVAKGKAAFEEMRRIAAENGLAGMRLEEINEEIRLARKEASARKLPNDETVKAIKEASEGKNLESLDLEKFTGYVKEL